MKTIISSLLFTCITITTFAQTASVTVAVEDLRNSQGVIRIQLLDTKETPVKMQEVEISDGNISVTFQEIPYGDYAIRYFHDENGNDAMDYSSMGIPTEGYGFSNDARGFMGPPDLEDQIITVSGDTSMTLKTEYW